MDSPSSTHPFQKFHFVDFDRFYVGRVLANVALVKVGAVSDLLSAKAMMRRAALQIPGAYIVFSGRTRRVVSKVVSAIHRP
jgi:hypothetical protein